MAEAPTRDLPSVGLQESPSFRLSSSLDANTLGAGVAGALSQGIKATANAMETVDEIEQKKKAKEIKELEERAAQKQAEMEDAAALAKHNADQTKIINDLWHPQTGLLVQPLKPGETPADMAKRLDQYLTDFDAQAAKNSMDMATDRGRQKYLSAAAELRKSTQMSLYQHEDSVTKAFNNQQDEAKLQNNRIMAGKTWGTPTADGSDPVTKIIAESEQVIRASTARNGIPKESADLAVAREKSAIRAGVVDQMLDMQNFAGARQYLDKYGSEIIDGKRTDLEKRFEIGNTQRTADRIAPDYMLNKDGQPKTDAEILNSINTDPVLQRNPELFGLVSARANTFIAQRKYQDAAVSDAAHDNAIKIVTDNGGDMSKIPAADLAVLQKDTARLDDVERHAFNIQKRSLPPDDSNAFYSLRMMASSADGADAFKTMDLRTIRSNVSPKDYGTLLDLQATARGQKAASSDIKGTMTADQIVHNVLAQNGITPTSPDGINFARQLNERVLADGGVEKIGTAGVEKHAKILMADTSKPGWLYGTNTIKYFQAHPNFVWDINTLTPQQYLAAQAVAREKGRKIPGPNATAAERARYNADLLLIHNDLTEKAK